MNETNSLPSEIVVTETFEGPVYALPPLRRGLGRISTILWTPAALLALCSAACLGASLNLWSASGPNGSLNLALLFVGALSAMFAVAAAIAGWLVANAHFEIELGNEEIKRVVKSGPLWWSARRPLAQVRQFTAIDLTQQADAADSGACGSRFGALRAECAGKSPFWIAAGYHCGMLSALAAELSRRNEGSVRQAPSKQKAGIPVIERPMWPEVAERSEQPAESDAVVRRSKESLSITIAPPGIAAGDATASPPLLGFAAIFSTIIAILSVGLPLMAASGQLRDEQGQPAKLPELIAVLSIFWLMCVCMWLSVVHRGRRGATLSVSEAALTVELTGLFGHRIRRWRRQELKQIRVERIRHDDSEKGATWTTDLRIIPCDGPPYKLLAYRPQAELEWIATTLRDELKMSAPP